MIHGSIWYMSAYTPGTLDRAHPTPHVTRPTTYQRPVSAWQTSGAPPSPSHALFPSRAQLAVAQGEGVGASGALASERAPQGFFTACAIRNERHVHLVLDELEGPVLAVLAPAGNPTPCAGSVAELVVEHVAALW